MSASTSKAMAKVEALSESLKDLESQLEPLFAKTLADTVAGLESVQKAKLYTVLPYVINDLIFVYLKTQGIDPKTHPVVGELERVRKYFAKIAAAEEAGKKRTTVVDKEAAGRFIKHAIASVRFNPSVEAQASDPQGSKDVEPRMTEKMRAREAYLRQVASEVDVDNEDVELEVFGGDGDEKEGEGEGIDGGDVSMRQESVEVSKTNTMTKKKRPLPMDPFASMNDDHPTTPSDTSPSKPKKKKKRKDESGASTPIDVDSPGSSRPGTPTGDKPSKKKKKKSTLSQA